MKKLIVFVCNGNIHRSVIAASSLGKILKEHKLDSKFLVTSYGLQGTKGTRLPKHKRLSEYPKEWKATKPILEEFGIDISKHSFHKISAHIMKRASVVIAMDNKVYLGAKNSLVRQFSSQVYKVHCFSELTTGRKTIKDLLGIGDKKLHRKVIASIYFTLNKKYNNILSWVK